MNLTKDEACKLIKKYGTNNPFEIADYKNIITCTEPLGSIRGFYNYYVRQKFIHINESLSFHEQKFVCAHELGHAVLHPKSNTPFLRNNTFFNLSKLEQQANEFAIELLLPDTTIKRYHNYTLEQIFLIEKLPLQLMHLKNKL